MSQKESQKWLHSLDAVYTADDCCPTTRFVSVGDREADVYDVLAAPRPAQTPPTHPFHHWSLKPTGFFWIKLPLGIPPFSVSYPAINYTV
jgi:hypothetical protein